jgi:UDP-2,3-diacylglucosamine pyrophosphatase LpxH
VSERLVLVSDLHLGLGAAAAHYGPRFVDEFDGDEAFPAFLTWLRSDGRRPSHLVLLGDTVDFLRVPVPQALYARNDAEAVQQLEQIATAHPAVFEALSATVNDGTVIDFVVGNHDVELARPAVQRRLRTLLGVPEDSAADSEAVRFHLWGYYVPGLLYAEHGNHYHDVNSFRRPLTPFHDKRTERPLATRIHSALRHLPRKHAGAPPLHHVFADLLSVDRVPSATMEDYYANVLSRYAAEIGLPVSTVRQLHELGRTSRLATLVRIAKVRMGHDLSFGEAAPGIATSVHQVLAAAGCAVPFCIFGHSHAASHLRLSGGVGDYLNTGTWSTDYRAATGGGQPAPDSQRRTWVELTGHGSDNPQATLLHWVTRQSSTQATPAVRLSRPLKGLDRLEQPTFGGLPDQPDGPQELGAPSAT